MLHTADPRGIPIAKLLVWIRPFYEGLRPQRPETEKAGDQECYQIFQWTIK